MSIEAMKLALQYIEANAETKDEHEIATGLRQAIREHAMYEMQRLGQEIEQEPVAWESVLGAVARGWCYEENANKTMDSELAVAIAKEVHALYTTPPKREWVGLTKEDIDYLGIHTTDTHPEDFIRYVEARLKEKNS
jgi:hypothetical protein